MMILMSNLNRDLGRLIGLLRKHSLVLFTAISPREFYHLTIDITTINRLLRRTLVHSVILIITLQNVLNIHTVFN